jgi:hypothetical protein
MTVRCIFWIFTILHDIVKKCLFTSASKISPLLTLILLTWSIGWVPNSIPVCIQQDATLHSLFVWELLYMFRVVLPPIIRNAYNCIYSIWYLSHRYCYLSLSWKSWNRFECAVGGTDNNARPHEERPECKLILSLRCVFLGVRWLLGHRITWSPQPRIIYTGKKNTVS